MRRLKAFLILSVMAAAGMSAAASAEADAEKKEIRIIATSDLHGKMLPWDYALDEESPSGSMVQLSTAISQYRNDHTLLMDAGDTIQDNYADLFVRDDDVHPMIQALNALDYDVWVTGNHEYNYGMDITQKAIADVEAEVLTGNVYDENGNAIADGYHIFDVDGVRVAVIGMVSPNITRWDAYNLEHCTVTDPLEETRKIIKEIEGQYDVLAGVFHMSVENEFEVPDSGVADILNACPEFDVMISSHGHRLIEGEEINGVLVVQNLNMAQTMAVIDLELEKDEDGWKVTDRASESVEVADFEPDPAMMELLGSYDARAREDARQVIGQLVDGPLSPENEFKDVPTAQLQDTPLMELIADVELYYSDADVASSTLFNLEANLYPGDIRKCDTSLIYKYNNMLYTLRMTGAQLKKFMEWTANYYQTWHEGDLQVAFNPDMRPYNYFMFEGIHYEINISKDPGSRIENLTWPDGTPVEDTDEFVFATNDYCANSHLLAPGEIYEEGDVPVLLETDIHSEIGGIREMIGDYIANVKGGILHPECDGNWKITGYAWDPELHETAEELVDEGRIPIVFSEDGRTPNVDVITEEEVKEELSKG